jgi:putative SOS response-associated peptidase YedK
VRSFTVVTTTPNALLAELHDRMPVILPPARWGKWLGEEPGELQELKALLVPCPSEELVIWAVDKRVGSVKNNDPSLIEPVTAAF